MFAQMLFDESVCFLAHIYIHVFKRRENLLLDVFILKQLKYPVLLSMSFDSLIVVLSFP